MLTRYCIPAAFKVTDITHSAFAPRGKNPQMGRAGKSEGAEGSFPEDELFGRNVGVGYEMAKKQRLLKGS
jgi:hypothetical protein